MYAQLKINEASFFWMKIKETEPTSTPYPFYFSAFLSAFRSITFVIQSQYKHRNGFQSLYDKVLLELSKDPLLSDLKNARNIALKEGSKVPMTIFRLENVKTGDVGVFECDPFFGSPEVIKHCSIEIGHRPDWLIPCNLPKDEVQAIYISQISEVINQFNGGELKSSPPLIRLVADGAAVSLETLSLGIENSLQFFNKILPEFNALA